MSMGNAALNLSQRFSDRYCCEVEKLNCFMRLRGWHDGVMLLDRMGVKADEDDSFCACLDQWMESKDYRDLLQASLVFSSFGEWDLDLRVVDSIANACCWIEKGLIVPEPPAEPTHKPVGSDGDFIMSRRVEGGSLIRNVESTVDLELSVQSSVHLTMKDRIKKEDLATAKDHLEESIRAFKNDISSVLGVYYRDSDGNLLGDMEDVVVDYLSTIRTKIAAREEMVRFIEGKLRGLYL